MSAYSFTDSNGTSYEIRMTFRTIFDVAERTGYDLLNPGDQQDDGFLLSNALLTKPLIVARVVAALVGDGDGAAPGSRSRAGVDSPPPAGRLVCKNFDSYSDYEKTFLDLIGAKEFPVMEEAFWKAYCDFFVQSGREWIATAFLNLLTQRTKQLEAAKAAMVELPKKNFSESSPLPASPTGSIEPSGKSPESPKPTSSSERKTAPKSSARSTTRTAPENKTSGVRQTSTLTKKPAPKKKPKNS